MDIPVFRMVTEEEAAHIKHTFTGKPIWAPFQQLADDLKDPVKQRVLIAAVGNEALLHMVKVMEELHNRIEQALKGTQ